MISVSMNSYAPRGFLWGFFLLTLALGASFGGFITAGMMSMDGITQDCPYMGETGYCNMNISEHLASWQNLFTTTLERVNPLAFLPLLTLFVLAYFFVDLLVRKRSEQPLFQRWRTRELFDPLRLAFARGIIHPKLYS